MNLLVNAQFDTDVLGWTPEFFASVAWDSMDVNAFFDDIVFRVPEPSVMLLQPTVLIVVTAALIVVTALAFASRRRSNA